MKGWYKIIVWKMAEKKCLVSTHPTWGPANTEFNKLEKQFEDDPTVDVQFWVREA